MTRMTYRTAGSAALVLAVSLPLFARPASAQTDAEWLLRTVADVSNDDINALRAGVPFVRTVETDTRQEMTLVYAIRVRAPVQFVLDRARSEHLLVDDAEGQHGRGVFSDPPAAGDLLGLDLERREIRELERCKLRDCGLKLSAETIGRLHTEIDWSSQTAREDANLFFRRELLTAVNAYSARGNEGAPIYADKVELLHVADGFDQLLADDDYLEKLDPNLMAYLTAYPAGRSGEIEDAFSWTIEDLGVKSVVSLNHIAVKPQGASGSALIGVKRVYANHYFQAGLRLIVLTPASDDVYGADSYITVITRLRFDGDLGGIKRTAIERRLERNAEAVLATVRDQLEAWYIQQ